MAWWVWLKFPPRYCVMDSQIGAWDKGGKMKPFKTSSLNKNERSAIRTADEILRKQFPIVNVILFGSKARGDSDAHSDIDLLLITSRPLHWKEEKSIIGVLFDIGIEYDVIFSPLFASGDEWEGGIFTQFPVYEEIMRDGAIVA